MVERGRAGDRSALDELARQNHAAAFRVAMAFAQDEHMAQDVVQDAFLKAFRSLDGFRGEASFRTWLLRITANEARSAIRRVQRKREAALEHARAVVAPDPGPDQRAGLVDEARRARSALARLPEKQRLAVSLRVDGGLSFREVGELIDSSEGAARVNYFHGIRKLRELLSGEVEVR